MGFGLVGRSRPGEPFRELPSGDPQAFDERALAAEVPHRSSHRSDVTVRHEKTRLAMSHGFADARRVGCDHRSSACRCLEIRDAPALLWRCEQGRPGTPEQRNLIGVADAAQKTDAIGDTKRNGHLLQLGQKLASTGNFERGIR